jgi:hypothetical protein
MLSGWARIDPYGSTPTTYKLRTTGQKYLDIWELLLQLASNTSNGATSTSADNHHVELA